jgi:hypothetical protein
VTRATDTRSPLAVVDATIRLCILGSALILFTLVFALLDPAWSRAALALQAVALGVLTLAAPWRPPQRLAIYALSLALATVLWDPTVPPTALLTEPATALFALAVIVAVVADLLLVRQNSPRFAPLRLPVHAGMVELDAAAYFFRTDPAHLSALLLRHGARLVRSPEGSTLVALEDVLAALSDESGSVGR